MSEAPPATWPWALRWGVQFLRVATSLVSAGAPKWHEVHRSGPVPRGPMPQPLQQSLSHPGALSALGRGTGRACSCCLRPAQLTRCRLLEQALRHSMHAQQRRPALTFTWTNKHTRRLPTSAHQIRAVLCCSRDAQGAGGSAGGGAGPHAPGQRCCACRRHLPLPGGQRAGPRVACGHPVLPGAPGTALHVSRSAAWQVRERGDSPAHNRTLSASNMTAAPCDCVQLDNTLSPAWTMHCSCCLSAWALPNQTAGSLNPADEWTGHHASNQIRMDPFRWMLRQLTS